MSKVSCYLGVSSLISTLELADDELGVRANFYFLYPQFFSKEEANNECIIFVLVVSCFESIANDLLDQVAFW